MILFLLIITIIINIVVEYFYKSIAVVLWGGLLIFFVLPHIAYTYMGTYSKEVLNIAAMFAILFNIFYFITRYIYNYKKRIQLKTSVINVSKLISEKLCDRFFYIYMLFFIAFIVYLKFLGVNLFEFTWTEAWQLNSFFSRLCTFSLAGMGGIGLILYLRKKYIKFIILTSCTFFYILIIKSRYMIIPFFLSFIIYFIFSGNTKKILQSIVLCIILIFSIFLLQQFRYKGGIENFIQNSSLHEIIDNSMAFISDGKGEFALSKAFYYFISNDNNFDNFNQGKTYIRLLLMPIPSTLIPFKPRDFAMDIYEAYYHNYGMGGTMHPILYGDVYANFGFMGILMGIVYALFINFINKLINKQEKEYMKILLLSLAGTMITFITRGAIYNAISNFFWGFIIIKLIDYLFIKKMNKEIKFKWLNK